MTRLLALALICLLRCSAQTSRRFSGEITGTLTGDDGKAIVGGYLDLNLLPPYPAGRPRQTAWATTSGSKGSFRFIGLSAGQYRLCAQVPKTTWLDPCEWGLRPPVPALSVAQPTTDVTVVLKNGAAVLIRIEDPARLLSQYEGKTPRAHLLLGVTNEALAFRSMAMVGQDLNGRDHQIVIPFDYSAKLVVFSPSFQLADEKGVSLATGRTTVIPLFVPTGQKATGVKLTLTGGGH